MKISSRTITGVTILLTMFVGAAAFVLSFEAVRELAEANGVPAHLSWLFPLLADTVVIAAGVSVIGQHFEGEGARFQWVLVVGFTLLSVALNWAHAWGRDWTAQALSIVPPLALFFIFELLSGQVRRAALRTQKTDTLTALDTEIAARMNLRAGIEGDIVRRTAQLERLTEDLSQKKKDRRADNKAQAADKSEAIEDRPAVIMSPVERRAAIARDIATANGHGAPSVETLADKYSVSVKTIRRDLADMESKKVSAN